LEVFILLIKKHVSKASFFKKTFLSFLTITIAVSIILATFLSLIYFRSINNVVETFCTSILSQTNYSVSYINELAERLSYTLYNDKSVISFLNLKEPDNMATIIASIALNKHLISSLYAESVYLYNSNIDLILSTRNGEQASLELFYDKDIVSYLSDMNSLIENAGKPITRTLAFNDHKKDICSYIIFETNKGQNKVINAIVINIEIDALTKSIEDINSQNTLGFKFMVLDNNGSIVGQSPIVDSELSTHITDKFNEWVKSSSPPRLNKIKVGDSSDTYFAFLNNGNQNNWYIVGLVSQKALFGNVAYATIISILVVILILLGCAFICLHLARKLNSPVKAITQIVKGEKVEKETIQTIKTPEFEFLASVFSSMKEQNQQFEKFKNETDYSLRQFFLNDIISGVDASSLKKLNDLNLKYIINNQLCLCILKIDNYKTFLISNNQKERWALRYAIVDIAKNVLSADFQCEVFSRYSDKFVVIINCEKEKDYESFACNLEKVLTVLQNMTSEHLKLSLTIAYSTFFRGVENLSRVYENVNNLVQQKIRYGNGKILNPGIIDETEFEDFEIPLLEEEKLVEKILSGEKEDAVNIYNHISEHLHEYNYYEITSYVMHLSYFIYNSINRKHSPIREDLTSMFKSFMINMSDYEVLSDINDAFINLINSICDKISQIKETQSFQTAEIVASKVISIIEENFQQKDLCLNTIADEIGLSPTYVGYLFKSVVGKSVAKYISDYRMEMVAHYLKTTRYPVAKIVDMVGLEKSNYFYTTFKKYFGVPLGKYKLTVSRLDNG